jgi:hypothetical protein
MLGEPSRHRLPFIDELDARHRLINGYIIRGRAGVPCEFTWAIPSFSMGGGTATFAVPVSSVCTVTATQSPIVGSDIIAMWVTLSAECVNDFDTTGVRIIYAATSGRLM